MKRVMMSAFVSVIILAMGAAAYASDYQGEENRGSIFQVVGDFINGNYKVDGKPLKEKGILQTIADQTKQMELSTMDKQQKDPKTVKP